MKRKLLQGAALSVGVVTSVILSASPTQAQSVDSLLDKLVEKGVLSTKEAKELREEADKDFNRSYASKSGMPDWVTALKFNGDLRFRYDMIHPLDDDLVLTRNRFRYRLRFGVTAVMMDNLEVGLRLASGAVNGNPISRNQTLEDNGSLKAIGIDQAFGRWSPIRNKQWTATLTAGKMANPFVFSDLVFDEDYTPEGLAEQFNFHLNHEHTLKLNLGQFALDELSLDSDDAYMLGAQVRWDAVWSKVLQTSFGVSALALLNEEALLTAAPPATGGTNRFSVVPNTGRGNTRTAIGGAFGGFLANNFNPLIADAAVTYTLESFPAYSGAFPIRLAVDAIHNPAAENKNNGISAGVTFGKSGKKGTWEVSYRYKYLEADAWYEEVVDSNTGAIYVSTPTGAGGISPGYFPGTNVKGHVLKASYSPYDALTFAATYYLTELIHESPVDSGAGRLQVDMVWKF